MSHLSTIIASLNSGASFLLDIRKYLDRKYSYYQYIEHDYSYVNSFWNFSQLCTVFSECWIRLPTSSFTGFPSSLLLSWHSSSGAGRQPQRVRLKHIPRLHVRLIINYRRCCFFWILCFTETPTHTSRITFCVLSNFWCHLYCSCRWPIDQLNYQHDHTTWDLMLDIFNDHSVMCSLRRQCYLQEYHTAHF